MEILRKSISLIMFLPVCLLCGCQYKDDVTVEVPPVTGAFDFTILKAGQADAIVMQTENYSIVLDCGEKDDGEKICEYLENNNIQNIDYMFITHFDQDHIGGFPKIMKDVTVSQIFVPDYEGNNKEYSNYLQTVKDKDLPITSLTEDTAFVLDDVLFEISIPKKQSYAEGDNDFSLVISITHGKNTFLFAGDAEKDRILEVLSEFGRQYDFLKVPHHGKYNKNTKRFINTSKPQYAVVTDSEKNPASETTISVLKSVGCKIYSTKNGDVSVKSDGKKISILQL